MASTSSAYKIFIEGNIVKLRKSIREAQRELNTLTSKKVSLTVDKQNTSKGSDEYKRISKELAKVSEEAKKAKKDLRDLEKDLKGKSKSYYKDYIKRNRYAKAQLELKQEMKKLNTLDLSDEDRRTQRKRIADEYKDKIKTYREQEQKLQKEKEKSDRQRRSKERASIRKTRYDTGAMTPSEARRQEARAGIQSRIDRTTNLSLEDRRKAKDAWKKAFNDEIKAQQKLEQQQLQQAQKAQKQKEQAERRRLGLMSDSEARRYDLRQRLNAVAQRTAGMDSSISRKAIKSETKAFNDEIKAQQKLEQQKLQQQQQRQLRQLGMVDDRSIRRENISSRISQIREVSQSANLTPTQQVDARRRGVQTLRQEAREERESQMQRRFETRRGLLLENDVSQARFNHSQSIRRANEALSQGTISQREHNTAVQGLNRQLQSQTGFFGRSGAGAVRAIRQMESYAVALGAVALGIRATLGAGNQHNKTLERETIGMQMLIAQNKIYFDENNNKLDAYRSMSAASIDAQKAVNKVIEINPQTPHTFEQTLQIFKLLVPQVMKFGGSLEDVAEITTGISVIAAAQGVEYENLLKTADSALSGAMLESGLKRALAQFDITNAKINELKENSGDVVGYIKKQLKGAEPAGEMIFNSWDGAMAQLQNSWNITWGKIEEPIFESLKREAISVSEAMNKSQEGIVNTFSGIGEAIKVLGIGLALAGLSRAAALAGRSLMAIAPATATLRAARTALTITAIRTALTGMSLSAMIASVRLRAMSVTINATWASAQRLGRALMSLRGGVLTAVPLYFAFEALGDYLESASSKADDLIYKLSKTREVIASIPVEEKISIKYELESVKGDLEEDLEDAKPSDKIDIRLKILDVDKSLNLLNSITNEETKAQIATNSLSKELVDLTAKYARAMKIRREVFNVSSAGIDTTSYNKEIQALNNNKATVTVQAKIDDKEIQKLDKATITVQAKLDNKEIQKLDKATITVQAKLDNKEIQKLDKATVTVQTKIDDKEIQKLDKATVTVQAKIDDKEIQKLDKATVTVQTKIDDKEIQKLDKATITVQAKLDNKEIQKLDKATVTVQAKLDNKEIQKLDKATVTVQAKIDNKEIQKLDKATVTVQTKIDDKEIQKLDKATITVQAKLDNKEIQKLDKATVTVQAKIDDKEIQKLDKATITVQAKLDNKEIQKLDKATVTVQTKIDDKEIQKLDKATITVQAKLDNKEIQKLDKATVTVQAKIDNKEIQKLDKATVTVQAKIDNKEIQKLDKATVTVQTKIDDKEIQKLDKATITVQAKLDNKEIQKLDKATVTVQAKIDDKEIQKIEYVIKQLRDKAQELAKSLILKTDKEKLEISPQIAELSRKAESLQDALDLSKNLNANITKLREQNKKHQEILDTKRAIHSVERSGAISAKQMEYSAENILSINKQILSTKRQMASVDAQISIMTNKVKPKNIEFDEKRQEIQEKKDNLEQENKVLLSRREATSKATPQVTPLSEAEQKDLTKYESTVKLYNKELELNKLSEASSLAIATLETEKERLEIQGKRIEALKIEQKIIAEDPKLTKDEKDTRTRKTIKEIKDARKEIRKNEIEAQINLINAQKDSNRIPESKANERIKKLEIEKTNLSDDPQNIKDMQIEAIKLKVSTLKKQAKSTQEVIEAEQEYKKAIILNKSLQEKKNIFKKETSGFRKYFFNQDGFNKKEEEINKKERLAVIENELYYKNKMLKSEKDVTNQGKLKASISESKFNKKAELYEQEKDRKQENVDKKNKYIEYSDTASNIISAKNSNDPTAIANAVKGAIGQSSSIAGAVLGLTNALFSSQDSQYKIDKAKGVTFSDSSITSLGKELQNAYAPLLKVNVEMRDALKSMSTNFKTASYDINTQKDYVSTQKSNWFGGSKTELNATGIDFGSFSFQDVEGNAFVPSGYLSEVETDEGLFSTTKRETTSYSGLDDRTADSLKNAVISGIKVLSTATRELELAGEYEDISKEKIDIGRLNLTGLDKNQVAQEISSAYSQYFSEAILKSKDLTGLVIKYGGDGEEALQTIGRIASEYDQTSYKLKNITKQNDRNFVLDFAKDIDENQVIDSYMKNFFSEREIIKTKSDELADSFQALNISMPKTSSGFRELVEGFKGTGEQLANVISLSDKFTEVMRSQAKGLEDVNDFLLGQYSFLSLADKGKLSDSLLKSDIRRVEIAAKTAKTQEEFNLVSKQYLSELSRETSIDVQKEIRDGIIRLNELSDKTIKKLAEINTSVRVAG